MIRVGLGGLGVCSLLVAGCVSTQEVAAPDGSTGQLVKCTRTEDCYEKAREVCNGAYNIVDSGNRAAVWGSNGSVDSTSWHEMLVTCKSSADEKAPVASTATAAGPTSLADDTAPMAAAGFTFGESIDATSTQCKNAGHQWKGTGNRYKCTGTPVDTGLDASARLSFCSDTLCRIEVISPPPAESAQLERRLQKVFTALTERYGQPTHREVMLPQSCTGAALGGCLEQNRARFLYQWSWKGKRAVTLTLGPKKIPDAFEAQPNRTAAEIAAIQSVRIRYDEGRTPAPAKTAEPAGETAETDREVGGL